MTDDEGAGDRGSKKHARTHTAYTRKKREQLVQQTTKHASCKKRACADASKESPHTCQQQTRNKELQALLPAAAAAAAKTNKQTNKQLEPTGGAAPKKRARLILRPLLLLQLAVFADLLAVLLDAALIVFSVP